MYGRLAILGAILLTAAGAGAAEKTVAGDWQTPTGSIVRVYGCGNAMCLKIVQIERNAPETTDSNNPDAALRSRSLCGLDIGKGFTPSDGGKKAEGGTLYDPKVGRTYNGALQADGDVLKLRGYVGLKLFGRSEEWNRVSGPVDLCHA